MVKTLAKTTFREIRQSLGRYLAILAIIAIGVAIFSGLRMSEPSMKETGVVYLDEYSFYDFRLISTLGFTEQDLAEFSSLDGIESASGSIFSEFLWQRQDTDLVLIAHSINYDVNTPDLKAGRLPEKGSECLADSDIFTEDDIGSTIRISPMNSQGTLDLFKYDEYTIVGLAASPLYLNYERGTSSIGSGSISAFVLMPEDAFESDIYYEIYLRTSKRAEAYSDEYQPIIDDAKPQVEHLLKQRAKIRYDELYSDAAELISEAETELADGWDEYNSEKAKAEAELADALAKLENGEGEYSDGLTAYEDGLNAYYSGLQDYEDGLEEISSAEIQLADGRVEFEKSKAEVLSQLADALAQLESGEAEYSEGYQQWQSGMDELAAAEQEIAENEALLAQVKEELDAAHAQLLAAGLEIAQAKQPLIDAKAQLDDAKAQLDSTKEYLDYFAALISEAEAKLAELDPESVEYAALLEIIKGMRAIYDPIYAEYAAALAQYEEGYAQYLAALEQFNAGTAEYQAGLMQYNEGLAAYEDGIKQLEEAKLQLEEGRAELDDAKLQLDSARAELDKGWSEYYSGKAEAESQLADAEAELNKAEAELADGKAQLEDAKQQLTEALIELSSAPAELADARTQLDEGWVEYYEGLAQAEEEFSKAEAELMDGETQLADAKTELSELKPADIFTLTRSENVGYACFDSDTSIVAAISVVFPVFFFLVAALVCMTTMKRMVDEQRTQIGVLKAIGYSKGQISGKYLFYSGSAASIGCVIGYILGSTVLPLILWEIYGMMYGFAPLEIVFDPTLAVLTLAAALLCSMGATWLSCRMELTRPSAELIRPKTPKAGKRVFLEHISFIWNRLSFLQKVSVRNVLRYQSRFIMMVLGIGGCTALLVTGFGINDSIANIALDQYGKITVYDFSVSFAEPINREQADEYMLNMQRDPADALLVHSGSTDVIGNSGSRTVYLVCPAQDSLDGFISLHSGSEAIPFPDENQAVINIGLAEDLDLSVGDRVKLRDTDFGEIEVTISALCDNYIYNYVYVSPSSYASQLGFVPEFNTLFVNSDSGEDPNKESVALGEDENVSSVTSSATFRDRLTTTLERLNLIVVVVVVCSGALAFVVLYNLTNINITERIREIATVKVLGFYPGETAKYVFREVNILAAVGSLAGLAMGKALHAFIMAQIQVEAMYFPCRVLPLSYILSFFFTMVFTVLITYCMRSKLRKVDMAESLKSIE